MTGKRVPSRSSAGHVYRWMPLVLTAACLSGGTAAAAPPRPLLLAHYMPWFEADPARGVWGWHWTMNRFDPARVVDGRPQIAAAFQPVIGPYDSADPLVVEYHLLLMKLSGIDGLIIDWYGRAEVFDHARLHRCAKLVVDRAADVGLKVAICYEDKTLVDLVKQGRIKAEERVTHAADEIAWLAETWFSRDHYLRLEGLPVLLSFGREGLTDDEWSRVLERQPRPLAYFSEHTRRPAAVGGFDWPVPREGIAAAERFAREAHGWPARIPVAFPRFVDIYAEAGVHPSWGRIEDAGGATLTRTLDIALSSSAPFVQLATWNDWGEGTQIEPSQEFGTRDLELVQRTRRRLTPAFSAQAAALALPGRLLTLRRADTDAARTKRLDAAASLLTRMQISAADAAIADLERDPPSTPAATIRR